MEWLTEHFDVLLPVALVLLFLFQRLFVREEEHGPIPSDEETEEEARRIQEEIRRKIIARQQGREPSAEGATTIPYEETRQRPATFPRRGETVVEAERPRRAEPPPVTRNRRREESERRREPPPRPEPVRSAAATSRDLQEQLRIQQERLRQARQAKEEALQRTSARGLQATPKKVGTKARPSGNLRNQLLTDLATAESMKRAFLLKEVVDRPISLRDRPDVFSNWG